jgi:hypothetical protein
MIAIGVFLAWAAYGLGLWGVSLLKGWNLGFKDIWSPAGYYTGKWPPPAAGNTVIIPDGSAASLSTASFQTSTTTSATGGSGSAPGAPAGISNTAAIQKAAAIYGWGSGSQWTALQNIISHESGGNPNALNAGSGAYGLAQSLTHGGCGGAGCGHDEYCGNGLSVAQTKLANCGNVWYQAIWMMNYIKGAYGSPAAAWAQYCSHPGGACWY